MDDLRDTAEERYNQDVLDSGDGEIHLGRDSEGGRIARLEDLNSTDMKVELSLSPDPHTGHILSILVKADRDEVALVEVPFDQFRLAIRALEKEM